MIFSLYKNSLCKRVRNHIRLPICMKNRKLIFLFFYFSNKKGWWKAILQDNHTNIHQL